MALPTITTSTITAKDFWIRSLFGVSLLFSTSSTVFDWPKTRKHPFIHFLFLDFFQQRASKQASELERHWTNLFFFFLFPLDLIPAARNDTLVVLFWRQKLVRYCVGEKTETFIQSPFIYFELLETVYLLCIIRGSRHDTRVECECRLRFRICVRGVVFVDNC